MYLIPGECSDFIPDADRMYKELEMTASYTGSLKWFGTIQAQMGQVRVTFNGFRNPSPVGSTFSVGYGSTIFI